MKKLEPVHIKLSLATLSFLVFSTVTSLGQERPIQLNELHPGYNQFSWIDLNAVDASSQLPITAELHSITEESAKKFVFHSNLLNVCRDDLLKTGCTRLCWFSRGNWFAPDEYQVVTTDAPATMQLLRERLDSKYLKVAAVDSDRVSILALDDQRDRTPSESIVARTKQRQSFLDSSWSASSGWVLFHPGLILPPVKKAAEKIHQLTEKRDLVNKLLRSMSEVSCSEGEAHVRLRIRLRFKEHGDACEALLLMQEMVKQHHPETFGELSFATRNEVVVLDILTQDAAGVVSSAVNQLRL